MGRSIKKGPFVQAALLKHVEAMNASGKKQVIKTWSRASTIDRSWSCRVVLLLAYKSIAAVGSADKATAAGQLLSQIGNGICHDL